MTFTHDFFKQQSSALKFVRNLTDGFVLARIELRRQMGQQESFFARDSRPKSEKASRRRRDPSAIPDQVPTKSLRLGGRPTP